MPWLSAERFRRRSKLSRRARLHKHAVTFHGENLISAHYQGVRDELLAAPKTWLVTGVAGFIGSNLLEALLALGQRVVGLDNFSTGYRENLDEALREYEGTARFTMIEGDIRDLETCRAACVGVDYVLHHAALGSVPWSIDAPLETNAVNVTGFLNILIAAKDAGVKRFVYASSSAVYGDSSDYPQLEERTGRALSPYAASKSVNESYAHSFQTSYGLQAVGLRYFNVFGKRQDPAGAYAAVIPRWIDSLLRHQPCRIFGDGETTRDFCYVANVVQANILGATAPEAASGHAYNVACASSVTLNQLFGMLRDRLASHEPGYADVQPSYEPFRRGDVRFSCAGISKVAEMLQYSPTHDVAQGIAEALPWYAAKAREKVREQIVDIADRRARPTVPARTRVARSGAHALSLAN